MKKILAALFVLTYLCGCTHVGTKVGDFITKVNDSLTHVEKATIQGGAGGALGGFVVAKLSGRDSRETAIYTLTGAAIGGLAANWYAKRQLERSEELQKKESDLDSQIEYAKLANADAEEYNKNLKIQIDKTKNHIKDIESQKKQKKITQLQLQKERNDLENTIKTAQENEIIMEAQVREIKQYRAKHKNRSEQELAEMDKEIATLEKKLVVAKARTNELAALKI